MSEIMIIFTIHLTIKTKTMNAALKKMIEKQDKKHYSLVVIRHNDGRGRAIEVYETKETNKLQNVEAIYDAGYDLNRALAMQYEIKMAIVKDTKTTTTKEIPALNETFDIVYTGVGKCMDNEKCDNYKVTFRNKIYDIKITNDDKRRNEITCSGDFVKELMSRDKNDMTLPILMNSILDFFYPYRNK